MQILFFTIILIFKIRESKKLFQLQNEAENLIEINIEKEKEYDIKPNTPYAFIISNDKYLYCFSSLLDNIFYIKNQENNTFEVRPNETFFEKGEKIYVNASYKETTKIKISPTPIYNELNSFETINENQYFFIKSEKNSIAYFDSFDQNSKVYISEFRQKKIFDDDKRINSKFIEIESNKMYLIKNVIFDVSVFKKYFYPFNLDEGEININNDNNKNFFYLIQNKTYTFDFGSNNINKMIKLSSKTLNSKIKIQKDSEKEVKELNKTFPYYKIDENFKGKLFLNVEENNGFIEFLSNKGDYEILRDEKKENYKIQKEIELIKIPYTSKSFKILFKSKKNFNYSLSLGLSNDEKYYYSSNSNLKINSKKNEEMLTYLALFKNIDLLKDEFLYLSINFEKEQNQDIFISYRQFSDIDEIIDEELSQEKCEQIIKTLKDLLELYVYHDIAQNPPEIENIPNYHHRKINLKEEIGKVSTKNRKFYEFYQEIKAIMSVVRDGHFELWPYETPKGIQVGQYAVYLPFEFAIKEYNGKKRLFITIKESVIGEYDNKTQEFISNHLDIPIKTINDMDPFDYIQYWHYGQVKNINSRFVHHIDYISGFWLVHIPFIYSNLTQNEFEFEDNKIIRISHFIEKPITENKEFNAFFLRILKKYKSPMRMPMLDEIKDLFLLKKGIKKEKLKVKNENKIKWDVIYEEDRDYMKCRVDDENKVNVFVQNTFNMDNNIVPGKIFKCAELFHSNNYPIIIIEDRNGGGYPTQSYLMIQLFQMREVERTYSAMRYSDELKKALNITTEYEEDNIYDPTTCKNIYSINDFNEVIDYYNYSGLNISHRRTNVFVELNTLSERTAYNEFRKNYENSENLKKPTDILIFTDGYSFSSASTLIKGFQNIGGAIIAGYFGNPKIEGIDLFDSSQSDSGVMFFEDTYISKNLEDIGFFIAVFTTIEVFDDSFQAPNPIPREYLFTPIDFRADIYSQYSDDNYIKFIEEGKKIFENVNKNDICNPKNKKLLLHDEKCKIIDGKEHSHGGYICGENGKWDKNNCQPYYCDIGFSFDQYFKKCVKDCISDNKAYFIFEDEYKKSFNIDKNETLELLIRNHEQYYLFEASDDYIDKYPKLSFIKGSQSVVINKDKQAGNNFSVNISSINTDINILSVKKENYLFDQIFLFEQKKIIMFQSNKEHILFFMNIFNNETNRIKYAIYNDSMKYQDILDINNEYFIDYSGDLFTLDKGQIYIIYFNDYLYSQVHVTINPVESNEIIIPKQQYINYLYLKKGNTYNIVFMDSALDIMLKLSRNTSNSKITIGNNKAVLDDKNLYYNNEKNNSFKIKVDKNDAILEFIYNLTANIEYEIFNLEKLKFNLTKELNIIKIPKNAKKIDIKVKAENESAYTIYHGYSILPFCHFSELSEENKMKSNSFNFSINEPYDKKINIMDNEYYIVMIEVFKGAINIEINLKEKNKDNKGLKTYQLVLIIVAAVIFLIIVILIIIICLRKKRVSKDQIEEINEMKNERILA